MTELTPEERLAIARDPEAAGRKCAAWLAGMAAMAAGTARGDNPLRRLGRGFEEVAEAWDEGWALQHRRRAAARELTYAQRTAPAD